MAIFDIITHLTEKQKLLGSYDFLTRDGFTLLEVSDTLNASIRNESPISRVKYVNSNSILSDNVQNQAFKKFIDFVERMLLFYSRDSRGYEGFMNGSESIAEGIVNSGKVKDFQEFLKENDIDYELYGCEVDGRKAIYCNFDNKDADFFKIASTGTRSLALFYYWYIRMEKGRVTCRWNI